MFQRQPGIGWPFVTRENVFGDLPQRSIGHIPQRQIASLIGHRRSVIFAHLFNYLPNFSDAVATGIPIANANGQ